jgi:peptidoglycan/LPS O-acetylase OafA/YrhL
VIPCHYIADVPHGPWHTWISRAGSLCYVGQTGVDLFFILSGFLIGGILLDAKDSSSYYRTFYIRRFYRIMPLYYSWLLLLGLLWLVTPPSAGFRPPLPYWTYVLFIQNYIVNGPPLGAWLGATWSLAIEEQFYLISPSLVRHLSVRRFTKLMVLVVVCALGLRLFLAMQFGEWGLRVAYYWTPCRADELAIGVLAAIVWRNPDARQWIQGHLHYVWSALLVSSVLLLAMLRWLIAPNSFVLTTYGRSVFEVFYCCLMLIPLLDNTSWIAQICRWRLLREMGQVSYCVYIIHNEIDVLAHKIMRHDQARFDSWPAIGVTLVAFATTIIIAKFSWRFFENPLIRRGHAFKY